MDPDPWLDRWLPHLREACTQAPLLELGCGAGRDTEVLAAQGFTILALDLDAERLAQARRQLPAVEFHRQDLRAPFPLSGRRVGAVVASLSLHYFPWPETRDIVARIHGALVPGGLLLCRLNSTRDHHHGASGHPALEPDYYLVDGAPKRFFGEKAVRDLFSPGWHCLLLEERTIHRYERPKAVWEAAFRPLPEAGAPSTGFPSPRAAPERPTGPATP